MHWTEELAQGMEKTMGRVILVFVITALASVLLGVTIGLMLP